MCRRRPPPGSSTSEAALVRIRPGSRRTATRSNWSTQCRCTRGRPSGPPPSPHGRSRFVSVTLATCPRPIAAPTRCSCWVRCTPRRRWSTAGTRGRDPGRAARRCCRRCGDFAVRLAARRTARRVAADDAFAAIVERDLATGRHHNPDPVGRQEWFTWFYRPDELRRELEGAGLRVEAVLADVVMARTSGGRVPEPAGWPTALDTQQECV